MCMTNLGSFQTQTFLHLILSRGSQFRVESILSRAAHSDKFVLLTYGTVRIEINEVEIICDA